VSEEGDCVLGEGGGTYIVLDPVDGTTNLAKGLSPAVTSLGVSETPRLSGVFAGLVMNLYTGDYYYAEREGGAYYGIKPIRPAGNVGPEKALFSLDMSKIPRLEKLRRILEKFPHLRWMGCSAMSLCNVASGILDAHLDLRGILRITDVAAGLIILKEAGGFYSVNERVFGDVPLEKGATLELTAASNLNLLQEINGLIR
jgi:myo-inositol-1(or 4)-monophosphatase